MKRLSCALALCLLPSCALLTGPIDRMVERQEVSLSEWEARQIEAQTNVNLTAEERVAADWDRADRRRERDLSASSRMGPGPVPVCVNNSP